MARVAEPEAVPEAAAIVTVPAVPPAVKVVSAEPVPPDVEGVDGDKGFTLPRFEGVTVNVTVVLSGTGVPLQSYTLASTLVVALTFMGDIGFSVTAIGVGVLEGMPVQETVTLIALLVMLPLEAVILTGPPGETAVTRPVLLTVALLVLLDDQMNVRFEIAAFDASYAVAVSCWVPPTDRVNELAGLIRTDATVAKVVPPVEVVVVVTGSVISGFSLQLIAYKANMPSRIIPHTRFI